MFYSTMDIMQGTLLVLAIDIVSIQIHRIDFIRRKSRVSIDDHESNAIEQQSSQNHRNDPSHSGIVSSGVSNETMEPADECERLVVKSRTKGSINVCLHPSEWFLKNDFEFAARKSILSENREKRRNSSSKKSRGHKHDRMLTEEDDRANSVSIHEAATNEHKCAKCPKEFSFIEDLNVHKSVHPDNAVWRCNNCQKVFKSKLNGTKPSVINLNTQLFQSLFVDQTELKQHIVYHFKEKPFECDICSKKFSKKESLCHHLGWHVGKNQPKKYQCKMCPRKYDFVFV